MGHCFPILMGILGVPVCIKNDPDWIGNFENLDPIGVEIAVKLTIVETFRVIFIEIIKIRSSQC